MSPEKTDLNLFHACGRELCEAFKKRKERAALGGALLLNIGQSLVACWTSTWDRKALG